MRNSDAQIYLPKPSYSDYINYVSGQNKNIIDVIHSNFAKATKQTKSLANKFRGNSDRQTAQNIWNFLKNEIQYIKDNPGQQNIKLPSRFVSDASGDCKSYSLFTAGILQNLNIPFKFRYTSYSSIDPTPQHVYVVLDSGIIIDGVWGAFNSEKKYSFKKDYKMRISTLSGIGCNDCSRANINGVNAAPVMIGELGGEIGLFKKARKAIKKTASKIQDKAKGTKLVKKASKIQSKAKNTKVIKTASKIQSKTKTGAKNTVTKVKKGAKNTIKAIQKIAKGVIGAAPRRAYRTLIALNFRGWANKLYNNKDKAHTIWNKAGGNFTELEKSISAGIKRKPLLGAKKENRVRQVSGIGEPTTLATIGAILAAATPLIILFKSLTGDSPESAGVDENMTSEDGVTYDEESDGNVVNDIVDNAKKLIDSFTGGTKTDTSGGQNQGSDNSSDDSSDDSSSGNGKTLLTLAAVGAGIYFLTKK